MDKILSKVKERKDALAHAKRIEREILEDLINGKHLHFLSVNWSALDREVFTYGLPIQR